MAKYGSRTLRVTANRLSNVHGQTRRFRPQCANQRFVRCVSAIKASSGAAVGTKLSETYRFTPRSTRVCVRVLTANSRLVGTFHGTFEVVTCVSTIKLTRFRKIHVARARARVSFRRRGLLDRGQRFAQRLRDWNSPRARRSPLLLSPSLCRENNTGTVPRYCTGTPALWLRRGAGARMPIPLGEESA